MKLKNKIKNFFTLPKEVFEEEECTKKFEKIKLFTLTRTNIFIGLSLFLIIINFLVGFDLNIIYLRQILGFLFLVSVPGLILMLCFKIRNTGFWEYLVYTIGLSIFFIMFAGLLVNWTLPWLGITDKPLSLYPILICFNLFLITLGIIAWKRNKDLKPFKITIPKSDLINRIFFIVPMAFPVLAILGAFLLNNHGPNILTMILLGGIALYVLAIVIFRKKLNPNIYPWALYLIGLSLLLMYSLRSWYFLGNDVVSEYHFFDLVTKNSFWDIINYPHGYNACLSINILPTIINIFMKLNQLIIFKLIMHLIFSFILIIIYFFFKKFSKPLFSFLAVFFFMSQIGYMMIMVSAIRQEIAFIFFGLMLLVLFTKEINPTLKKSLFLIFGASMIISHYSTSYIALVLFTLTYILTSFYKKYESRKIKKGKLHTPQKSEFYLTGILILFLLVFGFLWYSQVTPTSKGFIDFAHKSFSNFNNLFNQEFQVEGNSFLDQFKLKSETKNYNLLINEEVKAIQNQQNLNSDAYPPAKTDHTITKFIPSKILPTKFSLNFISPFYILLGIVKKLGYIFIFIGLIYSLILSKIRKNSDLFLISLIGVIFFSFIVLITIIPFGSTSYGVFRLYQQGLILFSIFVVIGTESIFNKTCKKIKLPFILLFLLIYFLSFAGSFNQLIGGNAPYPNLNNFGEVYDTGYISNGEINSIKWLSEENTNKKIYASAIYKSSFNSFGNLPYPDWNIFPQILKRDSYVYAGNSEVINKKAITYLAGSQVGYNFPTEFLNDNKNKIYNNGGSEIFK